MSAIYFTFIILCFLLLLLLLCIHSFAFINIYYEKKQYRDKNTYLIVEGLESIDNNIQSLPLSNPDIFSGASAFCNIHKDNLKEQCGQLTKENCLLTSCCGYLLLDNDNATNQTATNQTNTPQNKTTLGKCVAGSASGPTYTTENGQPINYTSYIYQNNSQ